jgi:alpha,alpha-trehalase
MRIESDDRIMDLRKKTLLVTVLMIQSQVLMAAPGSGLRCNMIFTGAESSRSNLLGVQWTPYSSGIKIPPVLVDPIVQYAIKSDSFREYLLTELDRNEGGAKIHDYKQIVDATPLYSAKAGPAQPAGFIKNQNPESLTPEQIVEYILTNYKLPTTESPNKAKFSPQEKRQYHPLREALIRQGLIPSLKNGVKEKGLIAEALQNLHNTWEDLLRKTADPGQADNVENIRDTLLLLPKQFVAAGGRFRESYFWDSFWIMKGLIESGYGETAKGMLENFVYLYEKYNIIPNGNRFYYLTRTQLPVLMEMVSLLENNGLLDFKKLPGRTAEKTSLENRVLTVSQNYYKKIWKGTARYKSEFGLFAYSDGAGGALNYNRIVVRPEAGLLEPRRKEKHSQRVFAETGWDMSYSRFGKDPQNWLPVDLNFMLMGYTSKLSLLLEKAGRTGEAQDFKNESAKIKENLKLLYDSKSGLYLDFNTVTKKISEVKTAASFFPFYFNAYDHSEASRRILNQLFGILKPKGHLALHTTDTEGDGQWDGAWTWAPLNETAFQSLVKYNMIPEARQLASDYCYMTIVAFYKNNHKFYEKYRAENGSIVLPKSTEIYGNEEGFGWTNATIAEFLRFLSDAGDLPALEQKIKQTLSSKLIN